MVHLGRAWQSVTFLHASPCDFSCLVIPGLNPFIVNWYSDKKNVPVTSMSLARKLIKLEEGIVRTSSIAVGQKYR